MAYLKPFASGMLIIWTSATFCATDLKHKNNCITKAALVFQKNTCNIHLPITGTDLFQCQLVLSPKQNAEMAALVCPVL